MPDVPDGQEVEEIQLLWPERTIDAVRLAPGRWRVAHAESTWVDLSLLDGDRGWVAAVGEGHLVVEGGLPGVLEAFPPWDPGWVTGVARHLVNREGATLEETVATP